MNTRTVVATCVGTGALALATPAVAAAAPDVVGQPYGDAASVIEEAGSIPVVAVRVGNQLPNDECIVTSATDFRHMTPMTDDVYFEFSQNEVKLALNCNGGHATFKDPGASRFSPEGRAALAAEAAASAQEQELAAVSTPGY